MSVNGWGGSFTTAGALASIQKACQRLNPCCELDVDVLVVKSAASASTYADWFTGTTKSNVSVDSATGVVRLTEGTAAALFSQTTASSSKHTFIDGAVSPGVEEYALDFFPDPNVTGGVPFLLDSLDLYLGRDAGAGVAISDKGNFNISVGYYDRDWRYVTLGDAIPIPPSRISQNGGVISIAFRNEWRRLFVIDSGLQDTRTGDGWTGVAKRTSNPDANAVSHLTIVRGLSISIAVSGAGFQGAFIGCVPNGVGLGQAPAFDTTAFWRYSVGNSRNCGPYNPTSPAGPGSNTTINPDRFLVTGAVPGYGAVSVANGSWGIARRVTTAQRAQSSQDWLQPYHVLRVATYPSTGSIKKVLDMGATPTNPVEIRLDDWQPKGTSMTYTLRGSANNSSWTSIGTVVDGQTLSGANLFRYYELTATFTPGPSTATKYASPALQAWSMVERITLSTYRYLGDIDSTVVADPVTAQSSIGELRLPIFKSGRVDFRDLATTIASGYAPSQIEAHVYARNTVSGTRLFLNLFRLEDRNPLDGKEEMTFVSGMDRLAVKIPPLVPSYNYPVSGTATIASVAAVLGGPLYDITVAGTPFVGVSMNNAGMTMKGVTGTCAGFEYPIVQNTSDSTFRIINSMSPSNVPVMGDTFTISGGASQRADASFAGVDFASAYATVIGPLANVPSRYIGKLPETTDRVSGSVTLSPEGEKALDVLQQIALHCGGFPGWNKGRIDFVDFFGHKDSVATWDERHYVSLSMPIGADRRMPSIRAKYGYDAGAKAFANQVTYDDYDSVLGWGRPNLFDVFEMPDDFCRWNTADEAAYMAALFQKAWKTGVRIWPVKTVFMWPWLEQGDAITLVTNQYTDRRLAFTADGLTDNGAPIAGPVSVVAVIVGKNLWGTEFLVAVRGLDAVTQGSASSGQFGVDPSTGSLIGGLNNFRTIAETSTERTIGWDRGAAVTSVWAATMEFDSPLPADPWAQVKAITAPLPDGQDTLVVKRPTGKRVLLVQCEPRDANLNITGDVRRMTLEGAPPQAPVITTTPGESGDTGTLFAKVQNRGETVVSVQVQVKVGASDPGAWQTPTRGAGATSYVNGGVLGADEYEHDVRRDDTRIARIQYRGVLGDGSIITTDPCFFDRNNKPNIELADGSGSVVMALCDADTKSVRIQRADGAYSYWIDGQSVKIDVAAVLGNGTTGSQAVIGTGEVWPIKITAYSLPRNDANVLTAPSDTASVTIRGATAAPTAVWQYANVAAPSSLGTKDVTLALQSSLSATYTTTVLERHNDGSGFTAPADITASLSPSLTAPPTALTDYTWSGLSSTYNLTLNENGAVPIEVELTCKITNGSGVVVDSIVRSAVWYYGAATGTKAPPGAGPVPDPSAPGAPSADNSWDAVAVAAPSSIGSKVITVTVDAATATGTAKFLFRRDDTYGWTGQTDISALVSPAITTPPTGSTAYTYTVPDNGPTSYAKVASGTPIVVEIEAQLYDDAMVLVATQKVTATWFYTDPRI